jgi:hypothetical protein
MSKSASQQLQPDTARIVGEYYQDRERLLVAAYARVDPVVEKA